MQSNNFLLKNCQFFTGFFYENHWFFKGFQIKGGDSFFNFDVFGEPKSKFSNFKKNS